MQRDRFLPSAPSLRQILNELRLLIGAKHKIHSFHLTHFLWRKLCIASCDHHKGILMTAHHSMNRLTAFPVCHIRHRTRVDQADICRLALLYGYNPQLLKHLLKGGCLREIEFATQGVIGSLLTLKYRRINHNLYKVKPRAVTECKSTIKYR